MTARRGRTAYSTAALALGVGLAPTWASPAEAQPREFFVVNTQDASVSRVDLSVLKEVARFPVGPRPYGIAVTKDGKTVAVGVEDEEKVKFFDAESFELRGEARIGPMHNDHIVLTQDGRYVLVANYDSDDVVGLDVARMKEAFRIGGASAPHVVKYGPLGKQAYVTCKKVTGIAVIDPTARRLVSFHPLNVNPRSLTFSPDESRLYFASFWVDGFFEMDPVAGKVIRLIALEPPSDHAAPQEVTYHGIEAVGGNVILAANEGRSYLDAVEVAGGRLLDRLSTGISKPCCVERIPGGGEATRALVSNLGDGSVQVVELRDGKLRSVGKVQVGAAPKRIAWVPSQ